MLDWKSLGALSALTTSALLLIGCDSSVDNGIVANLDGEPIIEDGDAPNDYWSFSEKIDPFTDTHNSTMTALVRGKFATVETKVRCSGAKNVDFR